MFHLSVDFRLLAPEEHNTVLIRSDGRVSAYGGNYHGRGLTFTAVAIVNNSMTCSFCGPVAFMFESPRVPKPRPEDFRMQLVPVLLAQPLRLWKWGVFIDDYGGHRLHDYVALMVVS